MPLSDIQCRNANSGTLKIKKLKDAHGLYLWVYADGKKYWRYRYYVGDKEKSLTLGVYPIVSLKDARARRDDLAKQRASGEDPSLSRKLAKVSKAHADKHSFETVAREFASKQGAVWSEDHKSRSLRRLEQNIFPKLGGIPIAKIDPPMLLSVLRNVEDRGATDLAHRLLQLCGAIFRYAAASGYGCHDVAHDIKDALAPHKLTHQPAVHPDDLPKLMQAIKAYDKVGEPKTMYALLFLMYTFVRTEELAAAEWTEVDFDRECWFIPGVRMKNGLEFIVPLSRQSLSVLRELRKVNSGRYIFQGRTHLTHMSNNTMLFALYRLGYKGKMTGHGARSVASTYLNECGKYRHDVIERQLAHVERNKVRGAYNRAEYLNERKTMMQEWADYLDSLCS